MIEPKDLELGKGERAVWLEELIKYRERGWFAFFFFLVAPGGGSWSWSLSSLALVRCDAKLRGDPSRRTERQVEQQQQ